MCVYSHLLYVLLCNTYLFYIIHTVVSAIITHIINQYSNLQNWKKTEVT